MWQAGLEVVSSGDVLDHRDEISWQTALVPDERYHEVGPDERAVLAVIRLLRPHVFAGAGGQLRVQVPRAGRVARMREVLQAPRDEFLPRVAEHVAHRAVDFEDLPVDGADADPDGGIGEHGREAALAGPTRVFGILTRGERRDGDALLLAERPLTQRVGVAGRESGNRR